MDSNSPRSPEIIFAVVGIGSAAPMDAPGAITMRLAESEIERRRRTRPPAHVREHRFLRRENRVSNPERGVHQSAGAVHDEDDRSRVLAVRIVDGPLDQMGHAAVNGALYRDDHDRIAGRHPRGDPAQAAKKQTAREPGAQPQRFHAVWYLRAAAEVTGARLGWRFELFGDDPAHEVAVGQAFELRHDRLHDGALVAGLDGQLAQGGAHDSADLIG